MSSLSFPPCSPPAPSRFQSLSLRAMTYNQHEVLNVIVYRMNGTTSVQHGKLILALESGNNIAHLLQAKCPNVRMV